MSFQIFQKKLSLASIFLLTFVGLGIYIRYLLLESPITPYALNYKILPNIDLSPIDIILSKFHPELAHWRIIFTNFIYDIFGLTEITYRVFPFIISIATLYVIFQFTKKRIGVNEAILTVLLFGTSYYSFWSIIWPHFPAFYFLASLLTIHFLWLGIENKTDQKYWIFFSFVNFLNITNVILPFLFLPPVFFIGVWLIWNLDQKAKSETASVSLYIKFLSYFFLSIAFALVFYQLKELNIVKNAFELITRGKFIDPILAPIPGQEYFESTSGRLEKLSILAKKVFITFNFYTGDMGVHGGKIAYGWFLFLFLLGQFKLFKNHRSTFIVFTIIFFPPIILLALGMNLAEERFLGFILPFYLISIASGFCFLFSKILIFSKSKTTKNAITFSCAFIIFTYLIHKQPIWNQNFLDSVLKIKGIVTIESYLKKHLKKNDIILNVTKMTELHGDLGDALNLSSYGLYLEKYFDQNRLSLLPGKTGEVGIWLILQEPLDGKNEYLPFYFPPKLKLKLMKSVKGFFLYFDKINLPDLINLQNESYIDTPFWSFLTGLYFQDKGNYTIAERYYQKMIKFEYNEERAYYNLGTMYAKSDIQYGLNFFLKALQILEKPTIIPKNSEILDFVPRVPTSGGMAANREELKHVQPMKYFWQPIGETKRKVWLKHSLLPHSKELYSPFYFTPAILSYALFDMLGDENYYQLAKDLFTRGLKLNPHSLHGPFIKKLLSEKLRNVPFNEKFGDISPIDLLGIHEHFPPLKIKS
jgi:tetratricopeptide (TPR) repeat protein